MNVGDTTELGIIRNDRYGWWSGDTHLGITRAAATRECIKLGVKVVAASREKLKTARSEALRLKAKGRSYREVAILLGIHPQKAWRLCGGK